VLPKLFNVSLAIVYNNEILVSESVVAGIVAITINSGAFIAEIVRSALESVDKGQWDAGNALGLSYTQILFHVVVPIALRNIMPALFNQFIISVKDTSILTIIVVPEITHQMQNYAITTFKTIPAYTFGALFYLSIISVLMIVQKAIENKLKLSNQKKH
jgi:glutamine transport system permease protein